MHIPNGLLDPKVSAGAAFAAAGALGYCISRVRQALAKAAPEALLAGAGNIVANISDGSKRLAGNIADRHIMKMGAAGSLIFAAQMFNFPVASGTSGHILGGILAAIVLGPFSGTIVMSIVLSVQSIFFADGGISSLGANILNMAVIGTFASYYVYYLLHRSFKNDAGFYSGIFLAGISSVLLASIACSVEMALSGSGQLNVILPAMAAVHLKIGAAEGLISIIFVRYLSSQKFDLEGKAADEE